MVPPVSLCNGPTASTRRGQRILLMPTQLRHTHNQTRLAMHASGNAGYLRELCVVPEQETHVVNESILTQY